MVLKDLNNVSIYIAPLYDDNLSWRDLLVESGFVGAYTSDKNRPYLEDKLFLMYDSSFKTKEALERVRKLKSLDSLYNIRYITIDKKHYTIYCLSSFKYIKDVRNLKQYGKTINTNAAYDINSFWKDVPVPELSSRLFCKSYGYGEQFLAELPEEDYYSYEQLW